jgi:hypothetical protein
VHHQEESQREQVDPAAILRLAQASRSDFRASVTGSNVLFEPPEGVAHLSWRRGAGLDWIDACGRVVRRTISRRFPALSLVNGIEDSVGTTPTGSPRWLAGWAGLAKARRQHAERQLGELLGPILAAVDE